MRAWSFRKRLHHGDADDRKDEIVVEASRLDAFDEPFLEKDDHDRQDLDEERRKEQLHWTLLFSHLTVQWAQSLASSVKESGSRIVRLIPLRSFSYSSLSLSGKFLPVLSPLQEERLREMQRRVKVAFDGSLSEHQDALRQLWRLAYPKRELPSLKSELWKEMGWQGSDPSTDFRGAGFISLENLIFFASRYPELFQRLLHKQDGKRAEWEYPFAVAGINISFLLIQLLGLQSGRPSNAAGIRFVELLKEDETAFDDLYCVAFQMMDAQWLAKRASYMEFKDVLTCTREQLERELALEDVTSVTDLPAYNMLRS